MVHFSSRVLRHRGKQFKDDANGVRVAAGWGCVWRDWGRSMMSPEQLADRGIRIKPLVWKDNGAHRHVARSGSETLVIVDMWRAVRGSGFAFRAQHFGSLSAAQAAAEADHAARVCAMLEVME